MSEADIKIGMDPEVGQKIVDLSEEFWDKLGGCGSTVCVNVVGRLCALALASYLDGPKRKQARAIIADVTSQMLPIYEQCMERVQ